MNEPLDWNSKTIAEFRANEGRVGGTFEGAPIVLVHDGGRKSGREHVTPVMYLPHDAEPTCRCSEMMHAVISRGFRDGRGLPED